MSPRAIASVPESALLYVKTLLLDIAGIPLYWISALVPRSRTLWVFGSWFGRRYSDNSRYLFEHCCDHEPEIRAVWLSHDPNIVARVRNAGREAHRITSLRGFWLACRAGAAILCVSYRDVAKFALARCRTVYLYHGTPLKKISYDDRFGKHGRTGIWARLLRALSYLAFPYKRRNWQMVASPAEHVTPRLLSAYDLNPSCAALTGSPRSDAVLREPPEPVPVIDELRAKHENGKIIIYAPTFRGGSKARLGSDNDLVPEGPLRTVDAMLARRDATLLVCMHFFREGRSALTENAFERIRLLSIKERPDITLLLPHADVLITDFSSLYYDYLLLDRPIVFAPFDFEQYTTIDRELYDEYGEVTPGPRCESWEDVSSALDEILSGEDRHAEDRARVRPLFQHYVDTQNSARVAAATKRLLDGRRPL